MTLAIVAAVLAACGGAAATNAPSQASRASAATIAPSPSPTASPSLSPTAMPEPTPTPTPTPAPKSVRELIAEKHPAVSAKAAQAAIKAAYAVDPKATSVFPYGLTNLACFDEKSWLSKEAACSIEVSNLYKVYVRNGTEEFYAAALATYNFFVNVPVPSSNGTKKTAVDYINALLTATWP